MRASVIPSAMYSCVASPERFLKGNTARDLMAGGLVLLALLRLSTKAMVITAATAIRPNNAISRQGKASFGVYRTAGSAIPWAGEEAGCSSSAVSDDSLETPLPEVTG